MLSFRRLAETNVPVQIMEEGEGEGDENVKYTPRNPITVKFCGYRNNDPEEIRGDINVVTSKKITFKSTEEKAATVLKMFPDIVMGDSDYIVFYKKKWRKLKRIQHLDPVLKEMVKRVGSSQSVIFALVINRQGLNMADAAMEAFQNVMAPHDGNQIEPMEGGLVEPGGRVQNEQNDRVPVEPGDRVQNGPIDRVPVEPEGGVQNVQMDRVPVEPGGRVQNVQMDRVHVEPEGGLQNGQMGRVPVEPRGGVQNIQMDRVPVEPGGRVQNGEMGRVPVEPGGGLQNGQMGRVPVEPGGRVQNGEMGRVPVEPEGGVQMDMEPEGRVQSEPMENDEVMSTQMDAVHNIDHSSDDIVGAFSRERILSQTSANSDSSEFNRWPNRPFRFNNFDHESGPSWSEDEFGVFSWSGSVPFTRYGSTLDRESEELPELSVVKWEECCEDPSGEEVSISQVLEPEMSSLIDIVQEIKTKPEKNQEVEEVNLSIPEKLSSLCSTLQLIEKCKLLKKDIQDLKTTRVIDEDLLTLLCLMLANESKQDIHIVTPDDVECIKKNIEPSKPNLDNVNKIIILDTDPNLTVVSVVNRDDSGEFYVNNIFTKTNDSSKLYMLKLLIKDICDNLSIRVKFNNPKYEQFEELGGQDDPHVSVLFSMLLTVRKMLGLGTEIALNEVDVIVDMIIKRLSDFESISQSNDSDSDIDWYSIKQENKRLKTGIREIGSYIRNGGMSN